MGFCVLVQDVPVFSFSFDRANFLRSLLLLQKLQGKPTEEEIVPFFVFFYHTKYYRPPFFLLSFRNTILYFCLLFVLKCILHVYIHRSLVSLCMLFIHDGASKSLYLFLLF